VTSLRIGARVPSPARWMKPTSCRRRSSPRASDPGASKRLRSIRGIAGVAGTALIQPAYTMNWMRGLPPERRLQSGTNHARNRPGLARARDHPPALHMATRMHRLASGAALPPLLWPLTTDLGASARAQLAAHARLRACNTALVLELWQSSGNNRQTIRAVAPESHSAFVLPPAASACLDCHLRWVMPVAVPLDEHPGM
jgi:hypothetical protein